MTTSHKLCIVLCIKCFFFLCVSSQSLLLSVNINPKLIRKVQLSNHPETVEQLFIEVRETLELEGDFSVWVSRLWECTLQLNRHGHACRKGGLAHCLEQWWWTTNTKHHKSYKSSIRLLSWYSQYQFACLFPPHIVHPLFRPFCEVLQNDPLLFQFLPLHMMWSWSCVREMRHFKKLGKVWVYWDVKMEILDKLAQEMFALKA